MFLSLKAFSRILLKLLLVIILIMSLSLCIPIVIISLLIKPMSHGVSNRIATISSYIFWSIIGWIFNLSVSMSIPDIPKGNYIVISNHISAVDFALINKVNKHMFQHSKYAFKSTLKSLPVFYQAFLALNYLKLSRSFEKDQEHILEYVQDLKEQQYPIWFILFCEGTRLTPENLKLSDKFCKENDIECFRNVLLPRYKGFCMLQSLLKDSYVNKVLDLTFYCDKDSFSLITILFSGEIYNIKCDARLVEMSSIEDNKEFLFDAFRRKDALIDQWKQKIKQD